LSGSPCFDALLLDAAPPALAGGSVTEFFAAIARWNAPAQISEQNLLPP
jgi:hypothetical protein